MAYTKPTVQKTQAPPPLKDKIAAPPVPPRPPVAAKPAGPAPPPLGANPSTRRRSPQAAAAGNLLVRG